MSTRTGRAASRGGPPAVRPPAGARRVRPGPAPAAAPARPPRPAGPPIDPRIAARREAVRRDERRRRLRRLLWCLAGAAGVAGVAGLTRTPLLDVDHVRVEGAGRLTPAEVAAVAAGAGAGRGAPLVSVDTGAVERALAALPAVADAEVARRFPGTVVIRVTEREPVAAVAGTAGRVALVAADGVVVDVGVPADGHRLPVLEGVDAVEEAGEVVTAEPLLAAAAAVAGGSEAVQAAVEAVAVGPEEGEVQLRLAAGGAVRLGTPADLDAKVAAVAAVLEQADLACLATLDVRVPIAPAVTREEGCR